MSGAFNYSQDKQSSQGTQSSSSNTGLQPAEKTQLSQFLEPNVQNGFGNYLNQQMQTPFQMPTLNAQTGMYDTQNNAVDQLVSQSTGTASSGLAKQGALQSNQTPLAAQRGIQSFLPQYLAQVGQNLQQQQLGPENVANQKFTDTANAFQQLIALLGGQSASSSQGSQNANAFNFNLSGGAGY